MLRSTVRLTSGAALMFLLTAFLLTAIGCGTDHSPVASADNDTAIAAQPAAGVLVFSTGQTGAAAKTIKKVKRIASKRIDSRGGEIFVGDLGDRSAKDDITAAFGVPRDALKKSVEITVVLHGETLDELVVEFAPGGLTFKKSAKLVIEVGENLIGDLDGLSVFHVDADGADEIPFKLKKSRSGVEITIQVWAFSRYSMGGGAR
jgi:hypothetical protein